MPPQIDHLSDPGADSARGAAPGATTWRRIGRRLLEPRPGRSRRIPLGHTAGIRLEAQGNLSVDQWVGLWESELARPLREILRPGMRCLDVGCFNAIYALLFAKRCRAPVIAYEPDPVAVARCERNLALNPELASWITLRPVAVGGHAGDGVVTLDEDLADEPVDFMLIDVDRGEMDVLSGALELLARQRPQLIVETHSIELERACGDLLLSAGYRPRVITNRRLLPQNRPIPHNRWLVA
jgi:SAM-dependent methyltransferase